MSSQKLLLCPGTTSKEYILQDEIQKGPYSTTYRAKHKKSQKPVILEVVPFDKINHIVKFNQFFEHQKMILRKCKHQNIIKLLQIFKSQSAQILVFENCNGGTLEDLIRHLKTLTENHAAYILSQILKAFKQLRKINAMHRDFKTQHIYFHNDIVKIGNFSLSKVQNSPNSTTDTSLGTAFTMAPQVLRGDDYQANADIWSIGTVCYKMIFGNYPFRGKDDEQILINMETQRPDYKGGTISQQCQDFIDKCLQIDPKQRFQWQTIFDHPFIKSFETRDFRQFKIKYALQRLQQLQKEFQLQRTQLQNQIKQLQVKLKQQKQNSKRKQKDIQFYRNQYQKQKKTICTLEKVIKDKNEEIEHYRKLLSNKQQETKQKQKLSETLYSKIKQYMNKLNQYVPIQSILGCVNTKTPLTIKNQQKTPQSLSNISKKVGNLNIYLFDESNYKQIQEMKNNFQKMKEKLSRYGNQSDQILRKRKGSQTTNNTDTYQSTTNASQIPEGMKETDTEIEKKKPQQLKAKSTLINSKQLKSQKPKDFFSVYNAFNKNKLSSQNQQPQTIDELTKELKIKLQKQQIKALQQKIEPKGSQQKKITKLQQQTFKGDNLYFEKSILQNKVQQLQQIIKLIQKDSKISSSTLIYKKSNNDKDLAHKINKIFSKNTIRGFLILVETINNNKFGIYCNKNNTSYKVILMNINSPKEIMNINSPKEIKFFYPRKQTKQIGYLYRLMSHRIWLGGKQIKITNKQPELQFDFDVEGDRYFEIQTIQQLTGSKDKHLNFKEIQVFDIRFQQ